MRARIVGAGIIAVACLFMVATHMTSQPSFNGTTPGCGTSGSCHAFTSGILSVQSLGNFQVRITLTGGTGNVAGEIVDSAGTVVTVNNGGSANPFTLTAPHGGTFTVNAGYKNPTRRWDSTRVFLGTTGVDGREPGIPGNIGLEQNYPNPFNPLTTIEYFITASGPVSLKVFDEAGREVAVLVDGWQHVGRHTVRWDGGDHPTGVYFYRLEAGRYSETKKLILVK